MTAVLCGEPLSIVYLAHAHDNTPTQIHPSVFTLFIVKIYRGAFPILRWGGIEEAS